MYTVILEICKNKKTTTREFKLGDVDTPEYNDTMAELSDILYDLDLDFDTIEGDGDMMVDDILIAISEEEEFERRLANRKMSCIVRGKIS